MVQSKMGKNSLLGGKTTLLGGPSIGGGINSIAANDIHAVNYEAIMKQLQLLTLEHQGRSIEESQTHSQNHHNSNEELDIFLNFDKMKIFVKYNPRFNYSSVISRFN